MAALVWLTRALMMAAPLIAAVRQLHWCLVSGKGIANALCTKCTHCSESFTCGLSVGEEEPVTGKNLFFVYICERCDCKQLLHGKRQL